MENQPVDLGSQNETTTTFPGGTTSTTVVSVTTTTIPSGTTSTTVLSGPGCSGTSPLWNSSIDYASLSSCVSQAQSGDTIRVAAGTATYSSSLNITKPLKIIGAGPALSKIIGSNTTVIIINLSVAGSTRISGFGFSGTGGSTQLETTMINLRGVLNTVRFDHLNFTDIPYHSVYVGLWDAIPNHPKILFDHIQYRSALSTGFQRFLKLEGNNNTWQLDDQFGSDFFVFIEDSSFEWTGNASTNSGVTDTEHGARLVVRYNSIHGGGVQAHDTGSTPAAKGQRASEVYNNTFSCAVPGCSNIPAVGVRGGGWLIYNNTFNSGFWTPAFPQVYRATVAPGYLGVSCNGTVMGVCNTPTYYHCSGGDHRACSYAGDSACNGMGSCVITASSSNDCPTQYPFVPKLDNVNGGSDSSGYPCRHQTGWGKESADGKTQEASPVYWWGNTLAGSAYNFNSDIGVWFMLNRDYCNHSPSTSCGVKGPWAYTPYTYPHPLQN